ncbi:MFS transporter [Streptomyces marincola]|uniref:hypothetical protein n=1 Tax=Streptomyces marincola TaxID=2878388 RepID=UPI001CF34DF4|nr:hypothetical protein [Streptomyces marincola]UCM87857.1 hypothetical protein LC193_07760 [Streptomyces marincola]
MEPPPAEPAKGYFTEGLRWVVRDPIARAMFAASGTVQFFNFMFHTLFVLYATEELGIGPGMLGMVLGLGAMAGGFLGTAIGLHPTLWIATVGAIFSVLWMLPSPIPRLRDLPELPAAGPAVTKAA